MKWLLLVWTAALAIPAAANQPVCNRYIFSINVNDATPKQEMLEFFDLLSGSLVFNTSRLISIKPVLFVVAQFNATMEDAANRRNQTLTRVAALQEYPSIGIVAREEYDSNIYPQ